MKTLLVCVIVMVTIVIGSDSAFAQLPAGLPELLVTQSGTPRSVLDVISFGNPASEKLHRLTADHSDVVQGGFGEPARRLLPLDPQSVEGGRLAFSMRVDPVLPNYATIRLWGSDTTSERLILFCEGLQVGYRHLGDIDLLDNGSYGPACNGRFFYTTTPLPLELTRGKTELACEIRSTGRIWGYGSTFEQYQKTMDEPTREIHRFYIHTDPYFVPPADEQQGDAPVDPPLRTSPGPEVMKELKERVIGSLSKILSSRSLTQAEIQFLAMAYQVKWTPAYRNQKTVDQVIRGLDALYQAYRKNPKLAESDPCLPNPEWMGLGAAGQAIGLLAETLKPELDEPISDGVGGQLARRSAWSEMLQVSREFLRHHRRQYTNQSMINDLYLYHANRGIAAIDPANALPEAQARHYLYESIGLEPWLGSDTDNGPERPLGDDYYQLTAGGLTKELGFVGSYGEVLDWVVQIYNATKSAASEKGDERIKSQLVKIAKARAIFRYPALDAEGFRAMRAETVIGWRDTGYPGDVTYGERPTRDGSAIFAAAATLDPHLLGFAQQMAVDQQLFQSVAKQMHEKTFRQTVGLLSIPGDLERVRSQPPSSITLPMSRGRADLVWTDEEDGVVAIKHGDVILYASLYWRARYAINFLARVHHITPHFDRIAVVHQDIQFEPSGMIYSRPDWINMAFGNGGHRYPGDLHSAHTGQRLPIAKIPRSQKFQPGDENIFAGKGSFYTLAYGPYLIGMNTTNDATHELKLPNGLTSAEDLLTGEKKIAPIHVNPKSTVVLYRSGTVGSMPLPLTPRFLESLAGNGVVVLSWPHSAGATSYEITRATQRGGQSITVASDLTTNKYVDSSVTNGETYDYVVTAVNQCGESQPTREMVSKPIDSNWPSPLASTEIGDVGAVGDARISNKTIEILGGANDIWGNADSFYYVYQPHAGDGVFTVRVDSQQDSHPWAKAGVMVRRSLEADSAYVMLTITPKEGVQLQYRDNSGRGSRNIRYGAPDRGIKAPYWLRLERLGSIFTGFISADGLTWSQVESVALPNLGELSYTGLAATSISKTSAGSVIFSNVTLGE